MVKIDVDPEVFSFLQEHARPFVDTPNDVLRNLLLSREAKSRERIASAPESKVPPTSGSPSAEAFVREFLTSHFGSGFDKRSPYRMMFESQDSLVYFQNFNKQSDHLWYRINEKPWKELRASRKVAWVVLTNPAERFGLLSQLQISRIEFSGRTGLEATSKSTSIPPPPAGVSSIGT